MARIILHWLNEEVKLSQEITSLTEDFRNGYLLGELLYKYNQQHHFHKFVDRDTPDAKIANFCLLEPTMRHIGVHFNSQIAFDIMNSRPGAMKTLLYEIRTVLESAKSMSKSADAHQMKRVMQIIKPSIPLYDQTMSATFENAIRSVVENPNDLLMERATHKFSNMTSTFRQSVSESYSNQMSDIKYELQRTKEIEREKRRHEKEFQSTWDQINKDQWKKNQIVARNRRNLTSKVTGAAKHRETARQVLENTTARKKAINSIDDFEDRLMDMKTKNEGTDVGLLALKTVGSTDDGTGLPHLSYLDEGTLRAGMIQNQREMQDRNEKLLHRQMERDRRRKRYVRLKESNQAASLQTAAEGEIFTRVLTTSELEEVEKLAKLRVMVYKDLFVQNAQNRRELQKTRREEYQEYLDRCIEYDANIELSWVITNRVQSQIARLDALEEAKAAAYNQESIETVCREIDRILDITDWVVNMRALGDYSGGTDAPSTEEEGENKDDLNESPSSLLPKAIMGDIRCMYMSEDLSIPDALPVARAVNVYDDFPLSLSWKPPLPDSDWLLGRGVFRGTDFMKDFNSAADDDAALGTAIVAPVETVAVDAIAEGEETSTAAEEGGDAHKTAPVETKEGAESTELPAAAPPADVISPSQMSSYLTRYDSNCFISSISSFEPLPECEETDKGKGKTPAKKEGKKGKNDVEEVETGVKIIPPAWIANTPSSSVTGEVIVAIRCVADPIPEHPSAPTNIPVFPLRIALCGASFAVKKCVANALKEEFGVTILRVDDLVPEAIALGEKLAMNVDTDEPVTPLESRSLSMFGMCQRGHAVDDDSYVDLLVQAICGMDADSPGYVMEDFPNTKAQAAKLITALSGVDYDGHRPQTVDKCSPFLTSVPRQNELFDAALCGLDKAFFIAVPPSVIARNRICLRKDLRTGEVVSISEDTKSVETLAELVTPRNAMDTTTLHVATTSHASTPMQDYLDNLGVASTYISEDGSENVVIEGVVASVRELVQSREKPENEMIEEVAEEAVAPQTVEAEAGTVDTSGTTTPIPPPVVLQEGALPPRLAKILADVWKAGEKQTEASSEQFFASMRELHYQMIQRRGAIRQVAVTQSLLRHEKQAILDQFREEFNSFDEDFRYDAELMNELYLRTLELRDKFWEISEKKASSSKGVIEKVSRDGIAHVLIHQARCEGASLLQAYVGLFVAGLNVLFDYMRATSSYKYNGAYGQVLEPTVPAINPTASGEEAAAGGKGKEKDKKGGKGSGEGRSPIAPPILWSDMEQLPPCTADEEEGGDGGKGKKDAKKVGTA